MPIQLNDPELERFLDEEGDRRGRITKAAALRVILTEARDQRAAKLPETSTQPEGESDRPAHHTVNSKN